MIGETFHSKKNLIDILVKNFNFQVIADEIFGESLLVDANEAYRFVLTTNSYYLLDRYGIRLFGRFRTFNHRDSSLIPGLFLINKSNQIINGRNLPANMVKKYPFIFRGNKKIIFIESHNTSEVISNCYKKIKDSGYNPEDYIVNLIHRNAAQWEHYFEYLTCEYFRRKGYLTDIQLPWNYHGRPDIGIYKHDIIEKLSSYNIIEGGLFFSELSTLRYFNRKNMYDYESMLNDFEYEFIVGEVKSKQKNSQIEKYLKTGICHKGFEVIPKKIKPDKNCGLLKIDDDNLIYYIDSPPNPYLDKGKVSKDKIWIDKYLKINLLGNFSVLELQKITKKYTNSNTLDFKDLLNLVEKIKINDILEELINGVR